MIKAESTLLFSPQAPFKPNKKWAQICMSQTIHSSGNGSKRPYSIYKATFPIFRSLNLQDSKNSRRSDSSPPQHNLVFQRNFFLKILTQLSETSALVGIFPATLMFLSFYTCKLSDPLCVVFLFKGSAQAACNKTKQKNQAITLLSNIQKMVINAQNNIFRTLKIQNYAKILLGLLDLILC